MAGSTHLPMSELEPENDETDRAAAELASASSERSERSRTRWTWIKRIARPLFFVLGVAAVVLLVRDAGAERVLATLLEAGPWLPLIVVLEGGFMAADVIALRGLFGEVGRRVPKAVWIRSAMMAYGVMQLLPAGRAGGEVARATVLAPYVGGARAMAMGTRLQAATLLGNTMISVPCYVAVAFASNAHSPLGYMVLGNGLITGVLGGAIVLASRRARVGGWLGKRIATLAAHGATFDEALRLQTPWRPAITATTAGRLIQAAQYGLILAAVGGSLSIVSALVSQAIHLVGAGLGDLVPNQVGITEGAYRLFAPSLGLEHEPARAIGIALIARICQFFMAGVCLTIVWLWKLPKPARTEGSDAGEEGGTIVSP
jgi:hypothetical protein